jgi:hypothetical protein
LIIFVYKGTNNNSIKAINRKKKLCKALNNYESTSRGFGVLGFWGFGVLVEISLLPSPCFLFPVP